MVLTRIYKAKKLTYNKILQNQAKRALVLSKYN